MNKNLENPILSNKDKKLKHRKSYEQSNILAEIFCDIKIWKNSHKQKHPEWQHQGTIKWVSSSWETQQFLL